MPFSVLCPCIAWVFIGLLDCGFALPFLDLLACVCTGFDPCLPYDCELDFDKIMFFEPLCGSRLHLGPYSCSLCSWHSCDRHGLLNIDKAQFRKENFRIKQRLISFSSG